MLVYGIEAYVNGYFPGTKKELETFLGVLNQDEVKAFRQEILAGHITGREYRISRGDYTVGCFTGQMSNIKGVSPEELYRMANVDFHGGYSKLEVIAFQIEENQKPDDNQFLALILGWVDEYLTAKEANANDSK
jgi:hypothetical protein